MNSSRIYKFNNSSLEVKFGNILDTSKEVIVSSDDFMLSMGGGVSMAILKKGGETIVSNTRKMVPAEIGDVVVTTAGKLTQKYVFHAITIAPRKHKRAGMNNKDWLDLQVYVIKHTVDRCFQLLLALNLKSVAFPCIGAGHAGFSYEKVADVMAESISENLIKTNKTYEVELYLFDRSGRMDVMDYIIFFENFAQRVMLPLHYNNKSEQEPISYPLSGEPNMDTSCKDVFISYSREDKVFAELVCRFLEEKKISYWIDRSDVHHSNDFKKEIVVAIKQCKIMLFISSKNSNQSVNVVKEVGIAEGESKRIIPIRIDGSPYNESIYYDLVNKDWADFRSEDSEDRQSAFIRLYNDLQFYLLSK